MTRRERLLRRMPTAVIESIVDRPRWRTWWASACIELWRRADEAADQEADDLVGPWRVAPPEGMV